MVVVGAAVVTGAAVVAGAAVVVGAADDEAAAAFVVVDAFGPSGRGLAFMQANNANSKTNFHMVDMFLSGTIIEAVCCLITLGQVQTTDTD